MHKTPINPASSDPDTDGYMTADGRTVKREWGTFTLNGNPMAGRWVLRDKDGVLLDFNQYRNDLFEHNGLWLS